MTSFSSACQVFHLPTKATCRGISPLKLTHQCHICLLGQWNNIRVPWLKDERREQAGRTHQTPLKEKLAKYTASAAFSVIILSISSSICTVVVSKLYTNHSVNNVCYLIWGYLLAVVCQSSGFEFEFLRRLFSPWSFLCPSSVSWLL